MSMINCKECSTSISSSAKICPQCGKKQGLGFIKRAMIGFVGVTAIGFFLGILAVIIAPDESTKDNTKTEIVSSKFPETSGIDPNTATVITATQLHNQYKKNEVQADEWYKNRYAVITGRIEEIRKDFMGDIIVDIKAGGMFTSVHITLKDNQKQKAIKLTKNKNIRIFATITGLMIGSVMCTDGVIL